MRHNTRERKNKMMLSTMWVGLALAMTTNGSQYTWVVPLIVWILWRRWEWSKGWGNKTKGEYMNLLKREEGQDIAEYAVMLAVILIIVIGTVQLIGRNATNVFSTVASSIAPVQQ